MEYLEKIDASVEMFTKLIEEAKSHDEQVAIAASEVKGNQNHVAQILLDMLEDKKVSVKSFAHPSNFVEPNTRRRLSNFADFNYFVTLPSDKPLDEETINYILRSVDMTEWEMYAEILGNRFTLKQPEKAVPAVKQTPVRQANQKTKNRNQRQVGK